jgi:glucosylceramidase
MLRRKQRLTTPKEALNKRVTAGSDGTTHHFPYLIRMKGAYCMNRIEAWLTTSDGASLLSKTEVIGAGESQNESIEDNLTILVDDKVSYQEMDGFGASFTDASAFLFKHVLDQEARDHLMKALFDYKDGIGMSFLRQPMGASDFTTKIYSYNDLEEGTEDVRQEKFSIEHDRSYIIPLLKEALALNPELKLMASPWSPPGWMKTSGQMIGGFLQKKYYASYADYFLKFIQAYEAEGLPIYAITIQNEPDYEPAQYPGMIMSAEEQTEFIRDHLGPAFVEHGLRTLIIGYDHNWDLPEYPLTILRDAEANRYVAGIAWHVYGGEPSAMTDVRNAFPEKGVWFTEASGGQWVPPFREAFLGQMSSLIQSVRNWSKSVVWWNIALDENNGPSTLTNSTCRGLVKIDQRTSEVTYNLDYYTMGHISKFVKPGAVRIESSSYDHNLESVAFRNPDHSHVLIVSNRTAIAQTIQVSNNPVTFEFNVPGESAVTFTW